ncbi:MAG TPA: ferritin-like domain-containing protein, partial [Planctomycetota bacterium]|nr:ferritin-like domain-containing protein [Planctomycetota bacterium]
LEDLYDAEKRLTTALPKMVDAATSPELKTALRDHEGETRAQINRLEGVFSRLQRTPTRETCEAMKGLIREGEEMISARGDDAVRDAAIIAAAQRVEHYEIAAYGTARTFAQQLGWNEIADALQSILDEEVAADHKLTEIAESRVNIAAAR